MPVASPTAATVLAEARFADPQPGPGLARERRLRLAARSASGATQEWQVVEWTADGGARSATRVLDGAGQTVGGAWHAPDEPPTVRLIGRFDDVWQAGLSVDAFERRTTGAACTTRADGEYLAVDCRVGVARSWLDVVVPTLAAQAVTRVEAASLWLRRADLRVARQQLLTRGAEGEWTITFDERARREIPIASAPSGVFVAPAPRPVSATVLTPVTPSAELQALDVTQAMPESSVLQVERRGDMLAVSGYVATAAERERLATSLRLVVPDGRLQLQVETYDEAAPRTRPGRARAELRSVGGVSPLIAYLSRPGTGVADPEATSTELAAVLLLEGARLRREAAAVAALLGRFPPGSAPSWTAAGRAAWHRMTGRALSVSTRALSRIDASLAPYCPSGPATSDAAADAGPREMNAAALAVRFLEAATRAYEAAAETVSADAQTDGRDPCARVRDAARQASAAAALLQTAIATTP